MRMEMRPTRDRPANSILILGIRGSRLHSDRNARCTENTNNDKKQAGLQILCLLLVFWQFEVIHGTRQTIYLLFINLISHQNSLCSIHHLNT